MLPLRPSVLHDRYGRGDWVPCCNRLAALVALLIAAALLLPTTVGAQVDLPELELRSEVPMGALSAVDLAGDHLFVGLGPRLAVLDLVDPARPRMLGFTPVLSDTVRGIAHAPARADRVFVAAGEAGVVAFDVSDPTQPVELARIPGAASSVLVSGDRLYVLGASLRILEARGADAWLEIGRIELPSVGFDVEGDVVWLATGAAGVVAYDISDPTRPAPVGAIDTLGSSHDIRVSGTHAFVADGGLRLSVLDVSDVTSPTLAGEYMEDVSDEPECPSAGSNCGLDARRVQLDGDRAVLSVVRTLGAFSGRTRPRVVLLDISEPATPVALEKAKLGGNPVAISADGSNIVVAQRPLWWYAGVSPCQLVDGGLALFDAELGALGGFSAPAGANAVRLFNGSAWVADVTRGVRAYDLTALDSPKPVAATAARYGSRYGSYEARDLVVDGSGARLAFGGQTTGYLAGASSAAGGSAAASAFSCAEGSHPPGSALRASPNRLLNGCAPPPGDEWFRRIDSDGTHDFLLDLAGGLQVVEPGQWRRTGRLAPVIAHDLAAKDARAYLGGPEGLSVIDAIDPTSPARVGSMSVAGHGEGIDVSDDVDLVAMVGTRGLMLVDVRQIHANELGSIATLRGSSDVALVGHTAYVVGGSYVQAFDVLDPTSPTEVARATGLRDAYAVAADDERVTVLAAGGLFVYGAHPDDGRQPVLPERPGPVATPLYLPMLIWGAGG